MEEAYSHAIASRQDRPRRRRRLSFYNRYRRSRAAGSQTNASDAVDDIPLGSNPSHDEMLDAGVQETFPAGDPVAVGKAETAYEKKPRKGVRS